MKAVDGSGGNNKLDVRKAVDLELEMAMKGPRELANKISTSCAFPQQFELTASVSSGQRKNIQVLACGLSKLELLSGMIMAGSFSNIEYCDTDGFNQRSKHAVEAAHALLQQLESFSIDKRAEQIKEEAKKNGVGTKSE